MRTTLTVTALALLLPVPIADGGGLNERLVDADAEWVLHVDVEGLVASPLGQFIMEHGEHFDIDLEDFEEMERETGIDPLNDFRSVTVYGEDEPDRDAVILVRMNDSIDGLIEKMQESPDYDRTKIDGHEVHVFDDGGESMYAYVARQRGDRLVALSGQRRALRRALKVIHGDADNLRDGGLVARPQEDSLIFIATGQVPWIEDEDDPASAIIRQSRNLTLDIGSDDERTRARLQVAATSMQTASDIADVIQGLTALGRLAASSEPELAPLNDLLDAIEVKSERDTIVVRVSVPTGEMMEHLLEIADDMD